MKRRALFLFILALVGASRPALSAKPDSAGAPAPKNAVWIQPVGSAVFGAFKIAYVALGANVGWDERSDVVVEATFVYGPFYACNTNQVGGWLSAGPSFHTGDAKLGGLFVTPKLSVRLFGTPRGGSESGWFGCSIPAGVDGEIGVGVDVGYQWRFGSFYLALVLGISGSACINCVGEGAIPWGTNLFGEYGRSTRGVIGANLNLVRLGFAF